MRRIEGFVFVLTVDLSRLQERAGQCLDQERVHISDGRVLRHLQGGVEESGQHGHRTVRESLTDPSTLIYFRILPGIAILSGQIFVCGGEVDSKILANGEVYDPQDDSWLPISNMMVPRCEFGLVALNGCLYAFGGWVGEDIGGSIEMYDPGLNQWRMQGTMQEPRFSMGIVSYQGLIYIVGGCTHSRRHMQELVSYNPVTHEWTTLASMLVPRSLER